MHIAVGRGGHDLPPRGEHSMKVLSRKWERGGGGRGGGVGSLEVA